MIDLGKFVPTLKFDTGAKYTVISVGELSDGLSSEDLTRFKDYCESKKKISATNWIYAVTATRR
jgi:hypothetical protein